MNSPAPLFNSAIFNTNAFNFTNYLTKSQSDQLYISLYLMPSCFGTATGNKIMITDASNSIQSINQIGVASSRAYVLESDVSSNQERSQRLNRAARIN
jgi:hypothetical protein